MKAKNGSFFQNAKNKHRGWETCSRGGRRDSVQREHHGRGGCTMYELNRPLLTRLSHKKDYCISVTFFLQQQYTETILWRTVENVLLFLSINFLLLLRPEMELPIRPSAVEAASE